MKKKLSEKMYTTLKLMVNGGATIEQLSEIHPLSKETMRRIKRTQNYDEYRALQERYSRQSAENLARKAAEPEQITLPNQISIDDLKPENDIAGLLKEHNELLRRLASDVAVIVSELCGKGEAV